MESRLLGLSELSPAVRRNLALELVYNVSAGAVTGLAHLGQVTVLGSLDGGAATTTIMVAAFPAANVLQPLWASAARRFRLQSLALASGALRCFPLLAIGWVSDAWLFTALIVAFYFVAGPQALAVPSLYKYNYPDSHRGRIIGLLRLVQNGVAMPVMLGCAALLDFEPTLYQIVYPIGGVIGLVGLFFYAGLRIPDDVPEQRAAQSERPTLSSIAEVLRRDQNFRLFQATIWLTGAGFLMSRPIWLYLLRDMFGLSQFELSLLVQVMPVVLGAITSPAWGWLIDRTTPVAGRVAFAWLGIFAYAAIFASFVGEWLWLAYAGAILRGLVLGAAEVATTAGNLYFSVYRERAALYESISSLFQGVRGLCMPLLGWLLFQGLHEFLFLLPTALNAWSLVLAVRLYRRDRAEPPAEALAKLEMQEEGIDRQE
jgi:MFS family permease